MANYRRLAFCKRCWNMTNHWFMEDTPKVGLYTVECCKCTHRPLQAEAIEGSAIWKDAAIEENLLKEVHK